MRRVTVMLLTALVVLGASASAAAGKVSHKGWPTIDGIFWKATGDADQAHAGGPQNDELLGHHGSDRISGAGGHDVLWGDWDPKNNNGHQRDVLRGEAGDDWLYPSHGRSRVDGGVGNDRVWAFYGRGFIDCGPGRDQIRIRMNGAFRHRNCEVVRHFCAHGSDGRGGCRKPGARRR